MTGLKKFVSKEKLSKTLFGFVPQNIIVPFNQGKKLEGKCCVNVSDTIKEGQTIAETKNGLPVASSIPGIVKEILEIETPDGLQCLGAKISLKGEFSYLGKKNFSSKKVVESKKEEFSWKNTSVLSLKNQILKMGIINSFYSLKKSNSLYDEIEECLKRSKKSNLVVRLFDDDPSRITETFVSENYTKEVLEGAFIIAKVLDAENVLFVKDKNTKINSFEKSEKSGYVKTENKNGNAVENSGDDVAADSEENKNVDSDAKNENDLLDNFKDLSNYKIFDAEGKKYPSGLKNELIKLIRKHSENNEYNVNHKDLYVDSLTCYAVYQGIVLNVPFVSQFVYITGECLKSSVVMKVRIGTTLEDLIEQLGGLRRNIENVVLNGIFRGIAVDSLKIPVTKNVKSISFLSKREISKDRSAQCVRCGLCRSACPQGLEPDTIFRFFSSERYKFASNATVQTTLLCSECSLCNTVCPSRIPLSQTISIIKNKIKNGELNEV